MDAIIFIIVALIWTLRLEQPKANEEIKSVKDYAPEDTTRVTKLNDAFYEDPDAFMEIAHALGF